LANRCCSKLAFDDEGLTLDIPENADNAANESILDDAVVVVVFAVLPFGVLFRKFAGW